MSFTARWRAGGRIGAENPAHPLAAPLQDQRHFRFRSFERKDRDRRVSIDHGDEATASLHGAPSSQGRDGGVEATAQALAETFGEDIDRAINSDDIEKTARRVETVWPKA